MDLAELLRAAPRPLLLGLDIDGTLSEIVAHADDARLVDGALEVLAALHARDGVEVVLVTGRGLDDARRTFGLPGWMRVVGSHGAELGDSDPTAESGPDELEATATLDAMEALADGLVAELPGAWVERKPFSVALHVRQADPAAGEEALAGFEREAAAAGCTTLRGSAVVEVGRGPLDKGAAVERLSADLGAATVCFVGDDVTDERVFTRLGEGDVAIKVGDAPTIAPHRLADPAAVVELLWTVAEPRLA